jgi:hypothetical protein
MQRAPVGEMITGSDTGCPITVVTCPILTLGEVRLVCPVR